MDISSKGKYPSNKLSNFAEHRFILDSVQINSFEGFLQSLKFKEPEIQREVCKLVGFAAKKRGSSKKWWKNQTLYWQGVEYKRKSKEYQKLLDKAYYEMYKQSDSFKKALIASGDSTLTHKIGKNNKSETVLTKQEFISRLYKLRHHVKEKLF